MLLLFELWSLLDPPRVLRLLGRRLASVDELALPSPAGRSLIHGLMLGEVSVLQFSVYQQQFAGCLIGVLLGLLLIALRHILILV